MLYELIKKLDDHVWTWSFEEGPRALFARFIGRLRMRMLRNRL